MCDIKKQIPGLISLHVIGNDFLVEKEKILFHSDTYLWSQTCGLGLNYCCSRVFK